MSVQENFQLDLLVEFFNLGLHNILEKIIFKLPPRSVLVCKEVNKVWNQIFLFYRQSNNSRIKKIKEKQLVEEWRKKGPIIQKISLESYGIFQVKCFHMIGDDAHLIVAANINETKKSKIIVLSAKTLEVLKILDVAASSIDLDREIKMSMDESFLVANVHSTSADSPCYYFTWQRKKDYSLLPLTIKGGPEYCILLSHHMANVPFLQTGSLLVYKGFQFLTSDQTFMFEFNEWNLSELTKKTKTFFDSPLIDPKSFYPHRDDTDQTTATKVDPQTFKTHVAVKVSGYPERLLPIVNNLFKPFIVGHYKAYTAIHWRFGTVRYFAIYDNKTGKALSRFVLLFKFNPKNSPPVEIEVQFNQHHVAMRF